MWIGIAVIVAMGLYPPWQVIGGNPAGYGFLYSPPLMPEQILKLDWSRLLLQWCLVGFVTAGALASAQTASAQSKVHPTAEPLQKKDEPPKSAQSKASKTIKFPEQSLGEILVDAEDDPDYWEGICEARGVVKIPPGRNVQLEVPKETPLNLSAMKELDAHALQSIDFSDSEVQDADLAYLVHFSRLYEIDLSHTAIGDEGISHLVKVTSLKKIWLDKTKVSDDSLEKLKGLQQLAKISLTGTEVTEGSIRKFKDEFPSGCEIIMASGIEA